MRQWIGVSVLAGVLAWAPASAQQDGDVLPSLALHQLRAALQQAPRERQGEIARPFLESAQKSALSAEEEVALGELYFLALMGRPAGEIFEKYLDRDDRLGRVAWLRHQQIVFRARDQHDEAERRIPEFRRRFAPRPEDLSHTSQMVSNQVTRYLAAGDTARAMQILFDDVNALPLDLPMRSFRLLGTYWAAVNASGRAAEARTILERHRAALQKRVESAGNAQAASADAWTERPHRSGILHIDPEIGLANDEPAFDADAHATRIAVDRIRELDAMLSGRAPGTS